VRQGPFPDSRPQADAAPCHTPCALWIEAKLAARCPGRFIRAVLASCQLFPVSPDNRHMDER
jgi:hypothetical protein